MSTTRNRETAFSRNLGPISWAPALSLAPERSIARYYESTLRLLPGVTIPLRSMLIQTGDTKILISPVGTDEETAGVGRRLTTLVAPSLLHHRHMMTARKRFELGEVWGPPGYEDKMPDLAPVRVFGIDRWPHFDHIDYEVIQGAPIRNEIVFFHRSSRTIYTADLFFNIQEPAGVLTPITLRLMGIHKRFAMGRMWRRWVTDKVAFGRSIDRILRWDFEHVVMAHGEIVASNARDLVFEALREQQLID